MNQKQQLFDILQKGIVDIFGSKISVESKNTNQYSNNHFANKLNSTKEPTSSVENFVTNTELTSSAEKLVTYIELMSKWNQVHNLTGIQDEPTMMRRHVLESLALLPFMNPLSSIIDQDSSNILSNHPSNSPTSSADPTSSNTSNPPIRLIDVGTGPGVPGIPLAVFCPTYHFVLLDSSQKKIHFIQHVVLSLGLQNVEPICTRVEAYHPDKPFQWVISRAFASLSKFITLCAHLCAKEGQFLAVKGGITGTELAQLPQGFKIERTESVPSPVLGEVNRTLVFVKPSR